MNEWMNERMKKYARTRIKGWINKWMNEWINEINKWRINIIPMQCIEYSRVGIYSELEPELRQAD